MLNGFAYCKMLFEQNQPTDFTYLEVNSAFETLTGLKSVAGKKVSEVIPGIRESDPKLLEIYGRVALTGMPERFETYVEALGMWFSISVYSPRKEYFVAVFDVITERKQMEQELRKSVQRFRELYDNAPVGYHAYDLEGRITDVNRTDLEMLGYTVDEMIGQTIWRFNVEEEEARKQILAKLAGTLPPARSIERTYRRKDGTTFPVLCQDRLILDERGGIKGIRCTIQDITERKRAEETLKKSEGIARRLAQENAAMAEVGRIASSTLNIEEVYERFAEEVKKIIRFDRIVINLINTEKGTVRNAYIAGEMVRDRNAGEIYPLRGSGSAEMVRTRSTVLLQTEDYTEDRDRFPMLLSTFEAGFRSIMDVPLFSKGEIIGGLLLRSHKPYAYTDKEVRLAERIGSQIAGAIANAQLYTERIDAEREKGSLEEQFRQSQKLEAIGQLAGGVAHDFNNLLTVIRGYSQLSLSELKEGDPLVENQQEILAASIRAGDLTRQLLAFSRKQLLEFKVLDLNSLIQGIEKMLRRIIGEDIELLIHSEGDLGRVKADPGQMEQVILNLAVNSRDAMPSGGKLILETNNVYLDEEYAHRHISVNPGQYVRLSVSDTGCGMTPEVKKKALEPFFTTKEKAKGTGLGLSTVYGIVKQTGGNVWIYSEDGKGTTIKIYLPRVDEPAEELEVKKRVEVVPRGSETVLVVEDEEMVRRLAVLLLEKQGYKVLEAPNGAEAFLVCDQYKGPIHLVVTDVVMPGVSGPELIDRLRQMRQDFETLYMSGYADEAVEFHGVQVKQVAFIQKPFTMETLATKVREVLDKAGKHSS
jgi:PAS domain S-box-containing protein